MQLVKKTGDGKCRRGGQANRTAKLSCCHSRTAHSITVSCRLCDPSELAGQQNRVSPPMNYPTSFQEYGCRVHANTLLSVPCHVLCPYHDRRTGQWPTDMAHGPMQVTANTTKGLVLALPLLYSSSSHAYLLFLLPQILLISFQFL
jgi:hypothetical protein